MTNLIIFTAIVVFVCVGGAWLAFHTHPSESADEPK